MNKRKGFSIDKEGYFSTIEKIYLPNYIYKEREWFSCRRMVINYKQLLDWKEDIERRWEFFLLVKLTREAYYGYLIDITDQQIKMQKKLESIKLTNLISIDINSSIPW